MGTGFANFAWTAAMFCRHALEPDGRSTMFSIGGHPKGHRTLPRIRSFAGRRLGGPRDAFRPAVELLEGRAMPSASPLSLVTPLAPIATVRVADAGASVVVTITAPIAIIAPAGQGVVIEERVFRETFMFPAIGESGSPSVSTTLSEPIQDVIGRSSALLAPESTALPAIPIAPASTPALAAASAAPGTTFQGAAPAAGLIGLPISQTAAPAPAVVNSVAADSRPTTATPSSAVNTTTATPLASIGYFLGSDEVTDEDMDQEALPPAPDNPAPANTPPVNVEPDRSI